jgi:hypothetical protein
MGFDTRAAFVHDLDRSAHEERAVFVGSDTRCSPVAHRCSLPGRRSGQTNSGLLAEPLEALTQQARHMHLRDADILGDLCLRHVLEEAQKQDATFAFSQ